MYKVAFLYEFDINFIQTRNCSMDSHVFGKKFSDSNKSQPHAAIYLEKGACPCLLSASTVAKSRSNENEKELVYIAFQ